MRARSHIATYDENGLHALQGGLGLEAYDRGGPALVKAIYEVRSVRSVVCQSFVVVVAQAAHLQEDGTTKAHRDSARDSTRQDVARCASCFFPPAEGL